MSGCLNRPITIPTGSNGKSCTVAYASDALGSNFSYTPTALSKYLCIVCKTGTITQADFTQWTFYSGTDGADGNDGIFITSAAVSNGVTAIGGTVYNEGSLIIGLSDGTYINAGSASCCSLNWNDITLINGWVDVNAGARADTAQWAVDTMGFLHLKGIIDGNVATATLITNDLMGLSSDKYNIIGDWSNISATPILSQLTLSATTGIYIFQEADSRYWNLATVPPIYIL